MQGYCCSFIQRTVYRNTRTASAIQLQSLLNIRQAKSFSLLRFDDGRRLYVLSQFRKCFLIHSFASVLNDDFDSLIINESAINLDTSASSLVLDAMIQSILYDRLKCQLGNHKFLDFLGNIDMILHDILVAYLLDNQIAFDMTKLYHDGSIRFLLFQIFS